MALDPSIILAGRSPDLVGQFGRGLAVGQQQNQIGQQNALAQLYRNQGAGIANGDPQALNALAGLDPNMALKVQGDRLGMDSTRLGMKATQFNMDRLTREEQRQVEEHALKLSADERAQTAAKIEESVRMGMAVQSPQEWDALMTSQGRQDLVGQFDSRQAIAAKYMTMAQVIAATKPAETYRPATPEEAARYGAAAGQFGPDGKFQAINPPSGMSVEQGPDGQLRVTQGPGVGGTPKPFTEAQSKDVTFATRAEGALQSLDPVANELSSLAQRALESDPTGIARGALQSDAFQKANNAAMEFTTAILRKDSGAAITKEETALMDQLYIPQPGDGTAVLEQKKTARRRAVDAMKAGMSPDQIIAQETATAKTSAGGQGSPQSNPQADQALSPEIQDLLKKYPAAGN